MQRIFYLDPKAPFRTKLKWDAMPRPQYGYGVYQAGLMARALEIKRISVIEFGVAGGKGLAELENIAEIVSREFNIDIDVYGFDSGTGMPSAIDYRDLPYIWQPEFFKMDIEKLKKRLNKTTLIIGEVSKTILNFIGKYKPAPIGFIAFDLDYYSSTANSFVLFEAQDSFFLPRVFCYFDDCIGNDWELHCQYTGELLAIKEFNEKHTDKKICKIHGFSYKRVIPSAWNEKMFVLHCFSSPLYNKHIYPEKNWQLEI